MPREVEICPVETTLEVIGGEWKVLIIWELMEGTKRFSQLHRALSGVTQKMLTQQLRQLEKDAMVNRKVYPVVPPRVEYSLTERGRSLKPIIDAMCVWGEYHIEEQIKTARRKADGKKKQSARPVPA